MTRLFLGMESLATINSGIGRLAALVVRVVSEEVEAGALEARGITLNDEVLPRNTSIPLTTANKSRWAFVGTVFRAHFTHTHFFYDFLGTARAHCIALFRSRPFLTMICGIEAWSGQPVRVKAARRATELISISAYTRMRASECDPTFARAKVCWLGTLHDVPPSASRSPSSRPQVLILARMDKEGYKGHKELIECWPKVVAAVPDAVLTIAGGGPGADYYRSLAANSAAADQIEFTGLVPEEKIDNLWNEATVFAMPSRGEGFGLVYIEAMRHGIPVIASVHDAGQEVNLDGQTGYNVNLDKPTELPERLIHLLRNPDHAADLGKNGQKRWAEHFRYSAFRDRFRPLLRAFLGL
jgi:phosphatidylinositol alpha-1,6-mannosyltransferase